MAENEAIERIKKDVCNNKCIPQLCNDGCMYGDAKCAFSMAIKALEEVQQYRALGTPEDLKAMKEHGAFTGMELVQLAAMQMRLREYEQIGTPKECWATLKKYTVSEQIAYYFARCTDASEVRELEDALSDIIEQERENRLHELKN